MGTFYSRVKEVFTLTEFIEDFVFSQKQLLCVLISVTAGQWARPGYRWRFSAGSDDGLQACECTRVFDGKWGEDPTELTEKQLNTSSHYPPGGWVWHERCSVHHTCCPHIQWDFWSHLSPHLDVYVCVCLCVQAADIQSRYCFWDLKATENEYVFLCWLVSRAWR